MTEVAVPSVRPHDAVVADSARPSLIVRLREFYPLVILLPMSIVLCVRMWGRVGEVAIDFGREVYVPWQIAQGRVLYRDLAYIFGPLSPYVNAVWWMIFGGGDRSVVIGNVLVLTVTCLLLWRIMLLASDRYAATLAMVVFLAYGAFGATVHTTNYNFLAPYAHSMTHGLAICAGIVLGLGALARSRKATHAVGVGVLVGLAALTKPEICLAATLAASAGLFAIVIAAGTKDRARLVAWFAAGAVVPPLLALALLWTAMPLPVAVDGWLGGWQHIGQPYVTDAPFYVTGMGMEFPERNAEKVLRYACLYHQFMLGLALTAVIGRRFLKLWWVGIPVAAATAVGLYLLTQNYPYRAKFWSDAGRGLPIFPLTGFIVGICWLRRGDGIATPRAVVALSFSVLAGALLMKLGMNARLFHYGFVLATPAAMLGAIIAAGWLPALVDRIGGYGLLVRAGVTAVVLGALTIQLSTSRRNIAERTVALDAPATMMSVTPRDVPILDAIRELRRISAPADTLAVFPEGSGLNFAAGRANPTPYDLCHPKTIAMYGEDRILRAYAEHPPDFIIRLPQNTAGFGSRWFGETYALKLWGFVSDHYERIAEFPLEDRKVELFRRRSDSSAR